MGWASLSTTESQCYCHQGLCQAGQHRCSQPTCFSCALRDNLEPHMHLTQHGMFSESLSDQPEKSTSLSVHPWVSGTDTGDEVIKRRDKGQRTEHMCKRRHVAQLDTQWTSDMEQHERRGGPRRQGLRCAISKHGICGKRT